MTHPRFVGPSIRDARLHTAAVLITIQVLGQTVLQFDLSVAQILISIGTSAVLEVVITARRNRQIVWPASALLTGNGVALILRVPGTVHGEWWSTRGWWIYSSVSAVSLLSKYVIRHRGRHVFNPSNFGLVLAFLLLGPGRAEPLDFWWGPRSPSVVAAAVVIVVGALLILRRLRLLTIALTCWGGFAVALGMLAAAGHCITARWHVGALCGQEFWSIIVTSPELLIFLGFMITDPRTVPTTRRGQVVYAAGVATVAVLLMAPQRTEFGSKVALLGALAVMCALCPIVDRVRAPSRPRLRTIAAAVAALAAFGGAVVGASAGTRPEAAPSSVRADFPAVRRSQLPPVRVAQGRLERQVSRRDAEAIVHDVVQDLALQTRVLRTRDSAPLDAFSARQWQRALVARMRVAAKQRSITVDEFDVRHVTVSVAMRRGQAAPAVLATLFGRQRARTFHDGRDAAVATGPWRPLAVTYEVLWDTRRYLVVSDELPEGWKPPQR